MYQPSPFSRQLPEVNFLSFSFGSRPSLACLTVSTPTPQAESAGLSHTQPLICSCAPNRHPLTSLTPRNKKNYKVQTGTEMARVCAIFLLCCCHALAPLPNHPGAVVLRLKGSGDLQGQRLGSAAGEGVPDEQALRRALEENLQCPVCRSLLYMPTTLSACGHSFCAECLAAVTRLSTGPPGCPVCRAPMPSGDLTLPVSFALSSIARAVDGDEYDAREQQRQLAERGARIGPCRSWGRFRLHLTEGGLGRRF